MEPICSLSEADSKMALSGPQVIGENTQSVKRNYYCDSCCKNCDTANSLAEHLTGNKHKRKLKTIKSQEQTDAIRLSVFMKAHMKEEPIVGLEYIIESKKEDSSYTYSCQLCGLLVCPLSIIVSHLVNPSHATCYIKKHFPLLFTKPMKTDTKRSIVKKLRETAVIILEGQGHKKEIQLALPESDGKMREASEDTPPSKPESDGKMRKASEDTAPSKPKRGGKRRKAFKGTFGPLPNQEHCEIYHYNNLFQKYIIYDPPLAKRSRHSPGGDQDVLPSTAHTSKHGSSHYNKSHAVTTDCTATQELEFKTNNEFFEYFANFVISNDEDFLFIRTIAQNCIKALTSFQEEDAAGQKTGHRPEASLEDASRTAHKIPAILEDETQSHLSNSDTSLLKGHSNPPSDPMPKNEATNLFFNSIKVVINPRKEKPTTQRHNELW